MDRSPKQKVVLILQAFHSGRQECNEKAAANVPFVTSRKSISVRWGSRRLSSVILMSHGPGAILGDSLHSCAGMPEWPPYVSRGLCRRNSKKERLRHARHQTGKTVESGTSVGV